MVVAGAVVALLASAVLVVRSPSRAGTAAEQGTLPPVAVVLVAVGLLV